MSHSKSYDVVIIGGGLAGLALARQLLNETSKEILMLERRRQLPPEKEKVGESLVQVGGYYFSKVLDLEEYLLREHFMKYNLRFYWKSAGRSNNKMEDFSQAYIRDFSNIPCYQLDRVKLEGELLRRNLEDSRFQLICDVRIRRVETQSEGSHEIVFASSRGEETVTCEWVVDTTGRGRFLARKRQLTQPNPIHHGASFMWVDGLVDIDKLNDLTPQENRLKQNRRSIGHLPVWLATNHFMGEGFWFWVIPLQGKTSLGLVYDKALFNEDVSSQESLLDWVCREFPLFERDLRQRQIRHFGRLPDFSHGCTETIHPAGWAMSGESGRFIDPLYSPGSDFIAIHNTLIVSAIGATNRSRRILKCRLYEQLMRALYEAYLPTFHRSYDALGDRHAFALKYGWELSVYFAFYVFPFVNDLFADERFIGRFLKCFSELGPVNRGLQAFLSDFYQWKKRHGLFAAEPAPFEFTSLPPLKSAQQTFYRIGLDRDEAMVVLKEQLKSLRELARLIVVRVAAVVVADPDIVTSRRFVEGFDLDNLSFDPGQMRRLQAESLADKENFPWSFDPLPAGRFDDAQPARSEVAI